MKVVFIILLSLFAGFTAFSQKDFFVYIQSDNRQPFYIQMEGKTYSSTESGYIILSNLKAQAYQFAIGFPKNAFPEQNFVLNINNKDAGYQLKNFDQKGWGLFNLQTLEVVMNRNNDLLSTTAATVTGVKKTDSFSTLLSNVVNDSSILYSNQPQAQPVTVKQTTIPTQVKVAEPAVNAVAGTAAPAVTETAKKEVTTVAEQTKETAVVAGTTTVVNEPVATHATVVTEPKPAVPQKSLSSVRKISETTTETALELVYVDDAEAAGDTIRISIPLTRENIMPLTNADAVKTTVVSADTVVSSKQLPTNTIDAKTNQIRVDNSDCKNLATDQDIDKLRVKLLTLNDLDEKLTVTKKVLKSHCFTVKQLKAISELFANDESKYRLFDLAYPYTLDTYNFPSLEELMNSEYYVNRFRAMINK